MIGALLLALQISAAAPAKPSASSFVVRNASRSVTVALAGTPNAPLIRPEALSPILPVTVKAESGGRYTVVVSGVTFGLEVGSRVVRVRDQTRQLASAR